MVNNVIRARLMAVRDGNYTTYVFKNLEDKSYVMCTKPPNWQSPNIDIGEEGFLHYQEVNAGENYYDLNTETPVKYKYSNIYFQDFVKKTAIKNKKITL